jgi:hypothetical protein
MLYLEESLLDDRPLPEDHTNLGYTTSFLASLWKMALELIWNLETAISKLHIIFCDRRTASNPTTLIRRFSKPSCPWQVRELNIVNALNESKKSV